MTDTPSPCVSKPVVGLTGGIASGKSTVAGEFAALGVAVVDADALAREVVQPGSAGLLEIARVFGPDYITERGELNREKMGAAVFGDPDARQRLNAITHPRVAALAAARFAALAQTTTPYVLYDVPLLIETGMHARVAAVVLVAAAQELQITRVLARDGLPRAAAEARIAAQFPLEKKIEVADFVLHNDGTLDALRTRIAEVHESLLARFGKPA